MKEYRKYVAAAAAAAVVTAVAPSASAVQFHDVTERYKEAVDFVVSKGAKGLNSSMFGTSAEIKRVDAAVLLANVLNLNTKDAPASGFKDVPARAAGAVNALKAAGITSGKTKTEFDSNSLITRGELAIWIQKGFNLKGNSSVEFKDVTQLYRSAVMALSANGITKGINDTEFGVNLNAKRGDYAIFLHKSANIQASMNQVTNITSVNNTTLHVTVNGKLAEVKPSDFVFDGGLEVKEAKIMPSAAGDTTVVELKTSVQESGKTYRLLSFEGAEVRGNVSVKVPEAPVNPGTPNPGTPDPGTPSDPTFDLTVLHTNDTHAHLENVAKRITAIKEERASHENTLLLDAGDVFSGTLYFNEFEGLADLEFMNMIGYDAMTFGNHEFDRGTETLAPFVEAAEFPFVSANVDFSADDHLKDRFNDEISADPEDGEIYNGIIKEINGEKVGIFGLTTADTVNISSPGEDVEFEDYIEEAEKAVEAFEDQGINKIIALTHIGYDDSAEVDNDLELAKLVDGIDVVVGGHSHTKLSEPMIVSNDENGQVKDPTVIVQASQYGEFLGTLDLVFDKAGKVIGHAGELVAVEDYDEDPEASDLLKDYSVEVEKLKETEVGAVAQGVFENPRTDGDITKPSVRKNETALGNLITDGMLAKAKEYNTDVIMALQNGGGIREKISAGPITVDEVIKVLPFGNTLATMEISGAELKQAFEQSFSKYPDENGGFLHVSGAKVEFDSNKPAGERVVSISYKNDDGTYTEIVDTEMYTVATNAFTAKGGDSYDVFKAIYEDGRVHDLGLSDWENFAEHLESLGTVIPNVEGRIVDVAGDVSVDPEDFVGTESDPAVHQGNVTVDVSDVSTLEHAEVKGNLTLVGTADENLTFTNIKVEGNLDVTGLDGANISFDGIEVDGETIL